MKTFRTMLKIELKLSLRGMDMFIFAICMPVVMVLILGAIYGNSPAFEGASYTFMEQSFGALTAISICAGGVMGLPLLVSDYRHKRILKRFQVTPVSPAMILGVHVVIYAMYAVTSLLLIYATAALFFGYRMQGAFLPFAVSYLLVMLSMFSIGMMVGGLARDMKVASMIASLLYFPMLIFSGATLPYEIMPEILQKLVNLLPLTLGIKILKITSLGLGMKAVILPGVVLIGVFIVCSTISVKYFRWE